jgi:hypothetical protein
MPSRMAASCTAGNGRFTMMADSPDPQVVTAALAGIRVHRARNPLAFA